MRPAGVRGLPGLPVDRGERIAIVAGAQPAPPEPFVIGDFHIFRHDARDAWLMDADETRQWDLPLGAVVCTVRVDDALPIHDEVHKPGLHIWMLRPDYPMICEPHVKGELRQMHGIEEEYPLGDFTPSRWGWMLTDPQPCDPIPCKGKQGVFALPADVAEAAPR
jgi:hypothetical protein